MSELTAKLPVASKKTDMKAVSNPMSDQEVIDVLKRSSTATCDPKRILDALGKIIPEWRDQEKPSKQLTEKFHELATEALPIIALDTHFFVAEIVSDRYRAFAITFAKQLIEEYQCTTASEKALAQNVAGTYARILETSKTMTISTRLDYLSHDRTAYYGMLSKELDRAQRQFASSLLILKQLKSPNLEVNIKAKNAFVSQNQQVNVSPESLKGKEPNAYETVDPK